MASTELAKVDDESAKRRTTNSSASLLPVSPGAPASHDDDGLQASQGKHAGIRYRPILLLAVGLLTYGAWSRYTAQVLRKPVKWGSGRFTLLVAAALGACARWLGVTAYNEVLEKTAHVRSLYGRQLIACWHPHGLFVVTPLFFHCKAPRDNSTLIYGYFTAVAAAVFYVPFLREILMLVNARIADNNVIDSLLEAGKSVFLCPGGIHEQLETDPTQERAFFPPNLGFIRLAIKHGVPLVPTYNFGENQLYDVPEWSRAFSRWLKRRLNVGIPFGVGRWGLPYVPKKQHITIHVGQAIEVGPPQAKPSETFVREIFRQYCVELLRLFNKHKTSALPHDVAVRGLKLIWRGHESEDPTARAAVVENGHTFPPEEQVQGGTGVQDNHQSRL